MTPTEIVQKYVRAWNDSYPRSPLWALVTPWQAGMHFRFSGHLIVINAAMQPESIIRTFFHEYGHAEYEQTHHQIDLIESEMAAIRTSLLLCAAEGLEEPAYREADAIKQMANADPYKSAVARLATEPIWIKYARLK